MQEDVVTPSEDELDDDLPSITVVSAVSRESSWSMPSAAELAEQREREQRNEDELMALRRAAMQHQAPNELCVGGPRSDSSGSEGEAALAAAVGALRVLEPAATSATSACVTTAVAHADSPQSQALTLLRALAPQPNDVENEYLKALQRPRAILQQVTAKVVAYVGNAEDPVLWDAEERVSLARVLCAAVVGAGGRDARRAAQRVLDGCTEDELKALARGGGPLLLIDGIRGGGRGGETLAKLLVAHELSALARVPAPDGPLSSEEVATLLTRCQRLPVTRALHAVALAGRALAMCGRNAPPPALPPAPRPACLTPAHLRLALATAKLQLIFRSNTATAPTKTTVQDD